MKAHPSQPPSKFWHPKARARWWRQGVIALGAAIGLAAQPSSAGDLLRGGAGGSSSPRHTAGSIGTTPPATNQERANALDTLARTTNALAAMQAMQAAARAAAQGQSNLGPNPNKPGQRLPAVPNGIAIGGLQPSGFSASQWQGANKPTQSTIGGATTVDIKQTAQQALLSWKTFNVGSKTTLDFDQSAGGKNVGQWIVFNKITDPSGSPSQILGSIEAPGQVYVINQNGIIFGGASQVNTHALVASSLPINDNLVSRGLLNNPDLQFLFSSITIPLLPNGTTPAFTPPAAPNTPGGRDGNVVALAGRAYPARPARITWAAGLP